MPNETNNRLELTGNEDDIKKFIELHKITVDENLWWNFSETIGLENKNDPDERYEPYRVRLVMDFNSRGGISSRLTIDSDWKDRGGKEEFICYNNLILNISCIFHIFYNLFYL